MSGGVVTDMVGTDMVGQQVLILKAHLGEFTEEKDLVTIRVVYYGTAGLCVAVEDKEGNLEHGISFSSIKIPKANNEIQEQH